MRLLIDLVRTVDGRLEGVVHPPGAAATAFTGVLDLLRVLEEIDLTAPDDTAMTDREPHMTTTRTDADPFEDIPGPRPLPLVGNAFDVDRADPLGGFVRMAQEYGPLFKIVTPGGVRLFVSGPELVNEVCDDERFDKKVTGGLANLRKGAVGSGLFATDTDCCCTCLRCRSLPRSKVGPRVRS